MKIYISPSNQTDNAYAAGGTTEAAQADRIAAALADTLRGLGHEVRVGASGATMAQKVAESNQWGADLHVCVHTDAGGGHGCTVMCYSGSITNRYVQAVYQALSAFTPTEDRGVRARDDLYEIMNTNAPCVYVEASFHDNPTDAQWIIDNATGIGQAIANGIATADGQPATTPILAPSTPAPSPAPAPDALSDGVVGTQTVRQSQANRGLTPDGLGGTDFIADLQRRAGAPFADGWIDLDNQTQVDLAETWFPAITVFRVGGGTGGSPSWKAIQTTLLHTTADGIPGPTDAAAFQTAVREGKL